MLHSVGGCMYFLESAAYVRPVGTFSAQGGLNGWPRWLAAQEGLNGSPHHCQTKINDAMFVSSGRAAI